MIGASISRWTMSYFAMALAWLLVALALMVAGVGYPAAHLASPDSLVLVHVVCIGWLSVAMCGALFQFVPVLVAKPLFSEKWALPALFLLNVGLAALLAGFLGLGGRLPAWLWLLPIGAILLIAGFGLVVVDLGLTAWLRPVGPARFVLVGLASLCATVAFGAIFAFAHAGWAGSIGQSILTTGVPLHAIAGLGGWLTLTAMGVSYRLLSMFMLSPDVDDRKSNMTLVAGALAIAVAVVGGIFSIWLLSGLNVVLSIAAVLGLATTALYGRDVIGIFSGRKRRQLELNTRMAVLSFASLAGTALLGVVLDPDRRFRHACRRLRLSRHLRLALGTGAGQALQDRGVPDLARDLRSRDGAGPDPSRSGPRFRGKGIEVVRDLLRGRLVRHADAAGRPTVGVPGGRGDDDRRHRRHRPGSDPDAAACGRREPAAPSGRRMRAASAVCQKLKRMDQTKGRSMTEYIDVDARPILRAGGEPFSVIMAAVERLEPGQGLRLYAPFKPAPLFAVMANRGFAHSARALEAGEWEVLFTPATTKQTASPAVAPVFDDWPEPAVRLDNRDLDPPEPMVRILAAAEKLGPGETLSALLRREPVFLFPQLEKRGFRWLGGFSPDGATYELTVRAPS